MLPARRPSYSAPWAWAASSITIRPWRRAISMIGSMSAGLAVEVDRQDRLGARRDGGLDVGRVDRERRRVDVDEHRRGAAVVDGRHGGDERVRRRDDLVAGADAGGQQRQVQGAGAGVGRRWRARTSQYGANSASKPATSGAEDELRALEDAEDGGIDLVS